MQTRYTWTNGTRRIVVDAADKQAAFKSFNEIRTQYFPDTTMQDWIRAGFTEQKVSQ